MRRGAAAVAAFALAIVLGAHAARAAAENPSSDEPGVSTGAQAEAQLRQRLRDRVRTIPGTDTQYLIGGYLQVDAIAARREQANDEQDTFLVSTTPFGPADRDYRLGVRQSQFNWLSRTPVADGHIWTRLEANLFPVDGTTAPTLNQLLVRWDDHVVIGKTYSTFMDDAALPTTLDYNGPGGVTFARQWLARGQLGLGHGWVLEASVEEPQADLRVGGPSLGVATNAERPDLAARVRYEGEGGHLQITGLSRRLSVNVATPAGTAQRRVDGSGVSVSGSLSLSGDHSLLFQAVTGKGIGRYFNDPLSATGIALDPSGGRSLLRTSAATLYYQHAWAPGWTSVAGASTLRVGDEGRRPPEALRRIVYVSANIIHRLAPTLFVGAEALWGEARRVDGAGATNLRMQLSLRWLVF